MQKNVGVDADAAGQRPRHQSPRALQNDPVTPAAPVSSTPAGGPIFRAIDKKTGKIVHEMELPASTAGIPMTYVVNERQYIVVAIGGRGFPGELAAPAAPQFSPSQSEASANRG